MLASRSPARRRLIRMMLVLVIVVVVIATVAVLRGRTTITPVAQDQPGPVLLLPGYGGSVDGLQVLASSLRAAGRDVTVLTLPGGGTGDLTAQARTLGAAADAARTRTGANSVDVVGYSAGGVVARIWARNLGGGAQARRIVTLGSPQHGTQLAVLAAGFAPQQCPLACQQLVPSSALLAALNAGDETPNGPQWVSLWTTLDQVVTPPESARLDGAVNIVLQDVCPASTVDHSGLPRDRLVGVLVAAELGAATAAQPGPGDCARLSAG